MRPLPLLALLTSLLLRTTLGYGQQYILTVRGGFGSGSLRHRRLGLRAGQPHAGRLDV